MNKSIIISLLLLFTSFNSILGDDCSSYYETQKFYACENVNLASDKGCIYLNNECKEQIQSCESYTGDVASECQAIIPLNNPYRTKCVFKDGKCRQEDITSCSDFNSGLPKEFCNYIELSDGVRCHFVDNECKTYYSECSAYTGNDQKTCESIELDNPNKYCSFTNNKCKEVKKTGLTCSSYKSGQDEDYCFYIELDNSKKYCGFYDNKCTEYFKECSDFDGTNEKDCIGNIPYNYEEYKCVYKGGKCTEQLKTCSDYKEGEDPYLCEEISLADEKKRCQLINGKCTEVKKPVCEYYDGTSKNECESIIPYDHSYKCVYSGEKCQKEPKTSCSEFTKGDDKYSCENIQLTDSNKYCAFSNNECKESYYSCVIFTRII